MSFGGFGASSNPFGSSGGGFGGSTFGSQPAGSSFGGFGSNPQTGPSSSFNAFGSGGAVGMGGGGGFGAVQNSNNDFEIPRDQNSPQDSISSLQFCPVERNNLLIVGSWDNKVRCYEIQDNGSMLNANMRAFITHDGPVLDVCFKDATACFSCGCDNVVKAWQFEANPGQQNATVVGKHDAPIKSCKWIPERSLLATAGWDGKLLYWDLRSPNPVLQCQMPNNARIDCLDVGFPYCVVATGGASEMDRKVVIYNLNANPQQPERVLENQPQNTNDPRAKPLKKQYRTLNIFPDKSGFAIASIEGRCSIQYFQPQRIQDNFAFKCHRDKDRKRIYAVNSLMFHKQMGTFASAGGDGIWNFWDKDSKQRLKASNPILMSNGDPLPITATSFNSMGNLFAYAVSYDWSKGASGNPAQNISTIMIHRVQESEIKPKRK